MEHNTTPDLTSTLRPHEILVVGSERGKAVSFNDRRIKGLQMKYPSQILFIPFSLDDQENRNEIGRFVQTARQSKDKTFYVLPFEGISDELVAPLFECVNQCTNVYLPASYWSIIDKIIRKRRYASNEAVSPPCPPVLSPKCLVSSNSASYSIKLTPQTFGLVIECGKGNKFQGVCVAVKDADGKEMTSDFINGVPPNYWDTRKLPDADYKLEFYFKEYLGKTFKLYIRTGMSVKKGFCSFTPSPDLRKNQDMFRSIGTDSRTTSRFLRLTSVVPGALTEFRELAFRITKYSNGDYDKILAVHDWIARNIHYDFDSLVNSLYLNTPLEKTAITALRTKRCVCQGYTDLSVALLRTLGIPAVGVYCHAESSGMISSGNDINHIFTFAYGENRWIPMDITWDSRNRYEGGAFRKDALITHLYFDMTIPFMSGTHRIIGYSS